MGKHRRRSRSRSSRHRKRARRDRSDSSDSSESKSPEPPTAEVLSAMFRMLQRQEERLATIEKGHAPSEKPSDVETGSQTKSKSQEKNPNLQKTGRQEKVEQFCDQN